MSCERYSGGREMADGSEASRMYGGHLSMEIPAGWQPSPMPLPFAAMGEAVGFPVSETWVAPAALGMVTRGDRWLRRPASIGPKR